MLVDLIHHKKSLKNSWFLRNCRKIEWFLLTLGKIEWFPGTTGTTANKATDYNNDTIFSLIHECFTSITSQIDFSRTPEATRCESLQVNVKYYGN